ncbi:penicillin-binding protein 2 [Thermosulfurimonas dismutans]|uniref:Penicillin-binding protein 2 (PBP-2) n=1 Tax=Thermosulfurimonas dismutans TaxID=999894 RepID=A0A179D717_9BACT|nr:penicillin-binding protein 2 [Thermosulfurimonas dismutans]OAQ21581.1 Penicillin-binding protein 2 (PBP-2) [Thermosulfurimonas dismutans]
MVDRRDREEIFQKRVVWAGYVFFFFFLILLFKLIYIQILRHDYFWKLAQQRTFVRVAVPAPRGRIYDYKGVLLAGNRPSFNLYLDPFYLKGREDKILKLLADLLEEDYSKLKEEYLFKKRRAYGEILLRRGLDRNTVARLEARRYYLPGLKLVAQPERFYPFGREFFHLVGYVSPITQEELKRLKNEGYDSKDFLGRSGLEKLFEAELRGQKGELELERDAFGRIVKVVGERLPIPGKDLYLTIDSLLQREVFRFLEGRSGAVVILSPKDGSLKALVSSPAPDANKFVGGFTSLEWKELVSNPRHPLLNKALQGYHPGSTFKPVTALAALKAGLVNPEESIYCPGFYKLGRRVFRCWQKRGHGKVALIQALAQSCDTYFYVLGERLDIDYLADFARACGFGKPSGLGLPGEDPGIVPDRDWKRRVLGSPWQKGENLIVAIGQGALEVNLVQLSKFYAALANGGRLLRPYVVARLASSDGYEAKDFGPLMEATLPVSPEFIAEVRKGLIEAVNGRHGTGRAAKLKRIVVAGKTGTAQVVRLKKDKTKKEKEDGIPYEERDHAWFVAFAPAEDPEIVVGVFVEHGGHGGSAAAPIAGRILKTYFLGATP